MARPARYIRVPGPCRPQVDPTASALKRRASPNHSPARRPGSITAGAHAASDHLVMCRPQDDWIILVFQGDLFGEHLSAVVTEVGNNNLLQIKMLYLLTTPKRNASFKRTLQRLGFFRTRATCGRVQPRRDRKGRRHGMGGWPKIHWGVLDVLEEPFNI